MNHKSLLLLPAVLLSSVAMADTVTPEQALGKANSFFLQSVNTRGQAQSLTLAHTAQADGETYYYVFNNPAGGYVIVGGDDVAQDVLAYSENGSFDPDQLSPAARWWLGKYQSQIHSAIAAERQGMATRGAATRAEDWAEVKPLLGGIEWDQEPPYNAIIQGSGQIDDLQEQYMTGCGATAMAQVMRYWKYPERGRFYHAYRWKDQQLETNFAESVYEWELMQEKYEETYSGTPEENAVAGLMSDVGIALNMNYDRRYAGGSGIPSFSIPYALTTYFGYDKKMELLERDSLDLSTGEWEEIVYSELAAQRPVIYCGGGHAFICDGYKDGFFHINWGWGGMANDEYYLLTSTDTTPALAPKDEGAGSNGHKQYSGREVILVGIQPDSQSEGFVYLTEPMGTPAEAPYGPQHYEGKLYNPTSQDVKAKIEICMQDASGIYVKDKDIYNGYTELVIPAKQEAVFSFDVPESKLIPGVTYLTFFSIRDESDPEITMEEYNAMPYWLFCAENIHIEGPEHVLLNLSNGLSSICVPFDAELPEGVNAYTAERITADHQVIMKQASSIEAGMCYVLVSEPIEQPIVLKGMKTTDEVWSVDQVFKGNLTSEFQYQKEASYSIGLSDEVFVLERDDDPSGVPPHKIIVDGSLSDAELLYFNFDEATGIEQVGDSSNGSGLRYNLLGQPQHEAKGLIIEDGRVTIIFRQRTSIRDSD